MNFRFAHRFHRPSLAVIGTLLGLAGCSATPDMAGEDTPTGGSSWVPQTVLVLPGPIQLELAEITGIPAIWPSGRRDARLGGAPIQDQGPSVVSVQIRDDQRVINGRVQSQTRWRTRTQDVRIRVR